jgi:hypothetical protein
VNFELKLVIAFPIKKKVSSGVPQGSILGPLLFTIYIADLPDFCNTLNVTIKLFADDLKAYHIAKLNDHFHKPLQSFIKKLNEYCIINDIKIAVKKCSTLHLGPKNPNHEYSLTISHIPNVQKNEPIRDLGIHFTNDLKWNSHINIIVQKSRRTSYALLRSIKSNNSKILINMFKTYIMPILEFSSPVFSPYFNKDILLIEKVQRDFLRMVYKRLPKHKKIKNADSEPPYADLLALFDLESLELRRLKFCINHFHKYVHSNIVNETNAFQVIPSRTKLNQKLRIAHAKKDVRFNSFFIRCARIYSQLDPNLSYTCSVNFQKYLNNTDLSKYLKCLNM